MKKYLVTLMDEERIQLRQMISAGKAAARKLMHARILLKADASAGGPNWKDEQISQSLEVGTATVERVRRQFVEQGLEAALERRKPDREYERRLDGVGEAHLIALACSEAPAGREHWTMQLLAEGMVGLGYVESVSRETVRRTLKKTKLKPWLKKQWCIPPQANAEFVCKMEDVLDVYQRPYDAKRPQVCLDEASKQLIGETRRSVPVAPGRVAREDYEYVRIGTANLFMVFEPLGGKRHVKVTDRRTRKDWARCVKELVDDWYPQAEKIVLVMDNLNTHGLPSLYEAFAPAEAKRLADKLEIHYTPKHGSWLDMAEIELGILNRQCLDRRIDNVEELKRETSAWETRRNTKGAKIDWRFTNADARIKLKRLYPSIE
ncbi:MAG TPA: IS630 family transposase [Chloroflexota bacterium]|nr:IS630 family transposase [Chloroflexota bacterium]